MNSTHMTKILSLAFVLVALLSCSSKDDKADILIVDNNRHYYPVVQGKMMDVYFELKDTTKNAVIINEIHSSCGVKIQNAEFPITLVPKKPVILHFQYDTNLNVGYVKHDIQLYGNFPDSAYRTLAFDVHVVSPADYLRDYEALHAARNTFGRDNLDCSYRELYYMDDEHD